MPTPPPEVHFDLPSLADPRLAAYRHFTSSLRYESPDQFIAEGQNVVLRLLASDYECESVLCSIRKVDQVRAAVKMGTSLFVAPDEWMAELLGFKFHSGVIAVGRRRRLATIDEMLVAAPSAGVSTFLVCPEITDPLNLGAILRNAAAFGVDGVLLGERCRDPFIRQSVRSSMGAIFSLRLARSTDLAVDLLRLRQEFGVELWASVLADDAEPVHHARRGERTAVLMGNEGPGLPADLVAACDRRVTIAMSGSTDSLNVAAASAVFLHHLTRPPQ